MSKQDTIIIDIDGVIFEHTGRLASEQWFQWKQPLPRVRAALDALEKRGFFIILMTARKHCLRRRMERMLEEACLYYDMLIMGVGSGRRILINDKKPTGDACFAYNIERNGDLLKCLQLEGVLE